MKRFLIERSIPGIGAMTADQMRDVATTSNNAVQSLHGQVQWVHSYIAADNTFCVYYAETEDQLREHSRLASIPITRINRVVAVIDPLTAWSLTGGEDD